MRVLAVLVVVLAACQQGDPNLSTDVQGLVIVNPSTHDFGSLQVGQTSAPFTVTISPSGASSSDRVDSVSLSCPDFSVIANTPADVYRTCETCCPAGQQICPEAPLVCCIADQQSFSFQTYFSPTVSGTSNCVVTISLNYGASMRTVTLTGTGTPPPREIDVHPTAVNFGDVRRATDSTPAGITVANVGGDPLTVMSVSASPGFSIRSGNTGNHDINAGQSETYSVICHPTAVGLLHGNFIVGSNDSDEPSVQIGLTCNGIDSNLVLEPNQLQMPDTRVGEPLQATISLHNTGAASVNIVDVSVTGQDLTMTSAPPVGTLDGQTSTPVTISFAATSEGAVTGSLVATDDMGQQHTAPLTAQALSTSMSLNPDGDIDFGPVCSGQTAQKKFSIFANDAGWFEVNTISTPDAPYMVTAPPLPAMVLGAHGNELMFTVTATPTAAGHQVSAMMVDTDIPGGTPHTINLAVDGLDAGVSAIPASVDFGANPIQTTTIGQEVHLSNCSGAAITAMNARIEGPDAADFAIVQQPDTTMIDPSGNASWLVVLQAHTSGTKSASFVVDYDGGMVTVPLTGEGLGDNTGAGSDGGGGGEKSYYTCAAGGASTAWPLVLVALALTVRRRRSAEE